MPNPNPRVPNLSNPICLICGKPTTLNKTLLSGAKQYRCRRHNPNFTCTDSDRLQGGQIKGKKPMTKIEANKRYRDRHRARYLKAKSARMKRTRKALKLIKSKETE